MDLRCANVLVDAENLRLVDYTIRIVPSNKEAPLPLLEDESKWVDKFEMRRPEKCLLGLKRQDVLRV